MLIVPWIFAALFAALALYFARRPDARPYVEAISRLAEAADGKKDLGASPPGEPEEVTRLRLALAKGWRPVRGEDAGERALHGLFRYLEGAALRPLEEGLKGGDLHLATEDAANALRDLAYFAKSKRKEETQAENLSAVLQGIAREYTHDTGIAIRFDGPPAPVPVHIAPEAFKDALYLLLANADRFGGGKTIELTLETDGDRVRLHIGDRGPGFTPEALNFAFDPFWSSEHDALGLGLPHARALLAEQGATLSIGNRAGGGGEAVIVMPRG